MTANFYILPESFSKNADNSSNEIEDKVYALSDDIVLIQRNKEENKLFVNFDELYPQVFYSDITVSDILTRQPKVKGELDRDLINAFLRIFEKATATTLTSLEIIEELLNWNDENDCHGIIAFNQVDSVNESFQIIYNKTNWYYFRRHFLGMHPQNGDYFIDECKKYYTNLFFHPRNKSTVSTILNSFARSITKHLGYLNDVLHNYKDKHFDNESIKYQTFTSECNLEAPAASKDSNDAKDNLTYEFQNIKHELQPVVCYPHLRLCTSDKAGDTQYYQYRIYFHSGIMEIENGKILIGHIGSHRP